jgi:hypothetical protein
MTQTDVYIARLSDKPDALDWGGQYNIGNIPNRLGPFFPPGGKPFYDLISKIKQGALLGQQVDWGAWAANVSKQDILDFIAATYQGDRTYSDPDYMPHLYPMLGKLLAFVEALPDERFALVASEL